MTSIDDTVSEQAEPRAHARIVYLGPVSPHWEVYGDWGDQRVLDEFRARVLARLVLLPREDPQFRRNRERIVRDAERELISIEWDLGILTAASEAAPDAGPEPDAAASTEEATAEDDDAPAAAAESVTSGDDA
ncbi:MAG: hypothetical protein AAFP84_20165 [Actinomycetota bacterium]